MTKITDATTNLLAPFDDETQDFLRFIDKECHRAIAELNRYKQELEEKDEAMPPDVIAMLNMIRAYGMLFNRCVDAGWINDTEIIL